MTGFRRELADLLRPRLKSPPGMTQELVDAIDVILDRAGVPRDAADAPPPAPPPPKPKPPSPAAPPGRLDVAGLRDRLGLPVAGAFDDDAKAALMARLANTNAPALTDADFALAAKELGVGVNIIKAVRKVEAPRGPFDDKGRPSILYEKHVFSRNTKPAHAYDGAHPKLSARQWQPGTYGAFSVQYDKLAEACALDPDAAFKACSWGAFQVLGENAEDLGYASAFDMAAALAKDEAAHLDCFVRFVKRNKLVDALRQCRAGDPASCVPFVKAYNGKGYAANNYHVKLAEAAK